MLRMTTLRCSPERAAAELAHAALAAFAQTSATDSPRPAALLGGPNGDPAEAAQVLRFLSG
jgi:hypothetical protein